MDVFISAKSGSYRTFVHCKMVEWQKQCQGWTEVCLFILDPHNVIYAVFIDDLMVKIFLGEEIEQRGAE